LIINQLIFKKMKDIILNTYKRERDSELAITAGHIDEQLENNPNFTDAPPELAEMKKLLPEYRAAVQEAKTRSKVAVSKKKDLKKQLVVLLTAVAVYVTHKCNGDRTMLLTSGFPISGEQGERPLGLIEKLDVVLGPPGIITTSVRRVAGSRAYAHQYATEPPTSTTSWHSEVSSEAKYTFNGLQSGKTYWLRVMVVGSAGQRIYSPVESRIVQ
jgi:hypothetical protein